MSISAILLNPGNRLVQGGTADFAMFGAQPATVSVGEAALDDGGLVTAFADQAGTARPEAAAPERSALPSLYSGGLGDGSSDLSLSSSDLPDLIEPLGLTAASEAASPAAGAIPSPAAPAAPVSPAAFPMAEFGQRASIDPAVESGLTANPFHAPVLDSIAPTVAPGAIGLAGGLAAASLVPVVSLAGQVVGNTLDATLPPVTDTLVDSGESGTAAVAGALDAVSAIETASIGQLSATSTSLAAVAGEAKGSVAEAVTGTIDHATASLAPLASTVADTATAAIGTVSATSGAVTGALTEAAGDSVATTVLPLVDHLAAGASPGPAVVEDTLGGTDPAAGIATLTALVGSAEVFEIVGGTVDTTLVGGSSVLDAVPVDGEASPLLGDSHAADDLLHHDDGPIGIGGS